MLNRLRSSPVLARVVPFAAFALLTILQGRWGDASQYWVYSLKVLIGAGLLWLLRPYIRELEWKLSWEAAVAGTAVFLIWIGLEGHYRIIFARPGTYNPERTYGSGSPIAFAFLAVRLLGSSVIVPPLEEIFYRSFLYRYLIKPDFLKIPLGRFEWKAFLITGVVFGIGHYEWLPGILCGFAYQGLVCRKKRMGDAISAHAVTNLLLGSWIIAHKAYFFW